MVPLVCALKSVKACHLDYTGRGKSRRDNSGVVFILLIQPAGPPIINGMICPRCRVPLTCTKTSRGIFFRCPQCDGRAVSISLLRRVGAQDAVNKLWREARLGIGITGADCPECGRPMAEILQPGVDPPLRLDVCTRCEFVWFDPKELEQFPSAASEKPRPLPEKAREMIAVEAARRAAEKAERDAYDSPGPEHAWQWIPALFGLPVEEEAPALTCWPWLTYGLAAALVAVFALTASHLQSAVAEYGTVPAQWARHGGLTLFTCFFLHANILHLIGNVYFLLIFGDNIESDLGRWQYVALLGAATLFGDLLHILGNVHSMIPCIGASGGISGVIMYYALRFPRARLGYLFWFWFYIRWIHVPAYVALLFWFALQLFYAVEQHYGVGNVAALAHLGGAAIGFVAWLLWQAGHRNE
jgi:membrane associated rhomboid family serine protease